MQGHYLSCKRNWVYIYSQYKIKITAFFFFFLQTRENICHVLATVLKWPASQSANPIMKENKYPSCLVADFFGLHQTHSFSNNPLFVSRSRFFLMTRSFIHCCLAPIFLKSRGLSQACHPFIINLNSPCRYRQFDTKTRKRYIQTVWWKLTILWNFFFQTVCAWSFYTLCQTCRHPQHFFFSSPPLNLEDLFRSWYDDTIFLNRKIKDLVLKLSEVSTRQTVISCN